MHERGRDHVWFYLSGSSGPKEHIRNIYLRRRRETQEERKNLHVCVSEGESEAAAVRVN